MSVPDFQTVMRPLLVALSDGRERPVSDLRASLASTFNLTSDDLEERLPSGRQTTFANRVGWATTHLYRCGLLDRPRRSVYRITDRGREVLASNPDRVDLKVLGQFPELDEFRTSKAPEHPVLTALLSVEQATPEERIEEASRELRAALAADLRERTMDQTPDFFEQLVLDVLHAVGYGGSREGAATRLGKSGDEGVDGVIREDQLGLDLIYVQAKQWKDPVGRPEVQKFFGALHGKRATKGVLITTSTFTAGAVQYAEGVTPRVILVDGRELAQLMIDNGVGVTTTQSITVARVDSDYFTPDDTA